MKTRIALSLIITALLVRCGGDNPASPMEVPTPEPNAPPSPIVKLDPPPFTVGYYYVAPWSLEEVPHANWVLTNWHGANHSQVEELARYCVSRKTYITYDVAYGFNFDDEWKRVWQENLPLIQILAKYGVLHSIYTYDEPGNHPNGRINVVRRNQIVKDAGFHTMVVGNTYEANQRPALTDYYGFSCYSPQFTIAQCTRYFQEASEANILLIQSFYGGEQRKPGDWGVEMPDQMAWASILDDPSIRERVKGIAWWLWPSYDFGGQHYVGARESPETVALHQTIARRFGVIK